MELNDIDLYINTIIYNNKILIYVETYNSPSLCFDNIFYHIFLAQRHYFRESGAKEVLLQKPIRLLCCETIDINISQT